MRKALSWAVGLGLVAGFSASALAWTMGGSNARSYAALAIALMSLVLTAIMALFGMFVAPQEQATRHHRTRHEDRVEQAAAEIRRLLEPTGELLLAGIVHAWQRGHSRAVREQAELLGDATEEAFHIAEGIGDVLEIFAGVLMVEARDLCNAHAALDQVPQQQWSKHPAARHLGTLRDYLERLHDGLQRS